MNIEKPRPERKRTICELKLYNEVTIDNFRQCGAPLKKTRVPFFETILKTDNLDDLNHILYNQETIDLNAYSIEDIGDWNEFLWVEKNLLTRVKKVLKQSIHFDNPYSIMVPLLFFREIQLCCLIPTSELQNEHSAIRFIKALEQSDSSSIIKKNLILKSDNLNTYEKFDFETVDYIKEAIDFFNNSQPGIERLKELRIIHEERTDLIKFISNKQGENRIKTSKIFEQAFVKWLDTYLFSDYKDTRKRLNVIGALIEISWRPRKKGKQNENDMDYQYERLRRKR